MRSRRGTLLDWILILAVVAVLGAIVHRTTAQRVQQQGRAAFSPFLWRVYDWRV